MISRSGREERNEQVGRLSEWEAPFPARPRALSGQVRSELPTSGIAMEATDTTNMFLLPEKSKSFVVSIIILLCSINNNTTLSIYR